MMNWGKGEEGDGVHLRMPDPSLKLFLLLLPNLGRIPQIYQNMLKALETTTEYLSLSFTIFSQEAFVGR